MASETHGTVHVNHLKPEIRNELETCCQRRVSLQGKKPSSPYDSFNTGWDRTDFTLLWQLSARSDNAISHQMYRS